MDGHAISELLHNPCLGLPRAGLEFVDCFVVGGWMAQVPNYLPTPATWIEKRFGALLLKTIQLQEFFAQITFDP